jgi:ABC-2 type transport system ATP-binding protein
VSADIELHDVTKVYEVRNGLRKPKTTVTAVSGLTMAIPVGKVTGLLGLNGAGKTTTIKMIATLLRPTRGRISVGGLDTVREARAIRRVINLISGAERLVYLRMTGRENLEYFGQLYDVPRRELAGRVAELLDLVGLSDAADLPAERYSRGMVQRLSIARGLINQPTYLLLDEPTTGLDAPVARELRAMIAELARRGTGILLTSHYLTEVEQLCERVHVIAEGRLILAGSPAEVIRATRAAGSVRIVVEGCKSDAERVLDGCLASLGGEGEVTVSDGQLLVVTVRHTDDVAGPIVTRLVGAGLAIHEMSLVKPSLEDAILRLSDSTDVPTEALL